MDGQFYGDMLAAAMKWLFIVGLILGIVICGLIYGGCRLASHYRIKVEKRPITTTSMVVTNTVTNYIYLPNTNK